MSKPNKFPWKTITRNGIKYVEYKYFRKAIYALDCTGGKYCGTCEPCDACKFKEKHFSDEDGSWHPKDLGL